ncbi:MAG TPA: FapA family protein, partial [bacterium]|nr:FapA family protein [bacterium]
MKISINNTLGPINSPVKSCIIIAKNAELKFEPYKDPVIDSSESEKIIKTKIQQPTNYEQANIVRKSIVIKGINEVDAEKKGMELLRLNKNNSVYTVLEASTTVKKQFCKIRLVEVKPGENAKKIKQKITPFDKNKPVVVEGENAEVALKKVSKYFNVPTEKLDYTLLGQKSAGLLGIGSKVYQFKVWLKREIPKSRDSMKEKIATALEGDIDGYFTLQNTDDGLMLTIYPPRGSGKKIEESEVVKELNLYGYNKDINFEIVSQAVAAAEGTVTKIAPRQPEPELDGKFEIKVSDDKLKASIIVYPPMEGGKPVTKEQVEAEIKSLGIKNYKQFVIDGLFSDVPLYCEEVVFAEGKPKINGKDATIDYKVNVAEEKALNFKEDESGRVDFHEMGLIENVVAGQVLARKVPATIGQNGEDIFGNIMPAEDGKDIQLTPGKNVSLSDDGMELVSDIDGFASFDGKKLRVDPIYHVNGDVSFETGNITFLGTVIVTGMVRDDFVIRASGDVFVGAVAAAEIEAEGNVVIRGGVSGRDKAIIKAGGSV